jgi:hypothetical protein
MHLNHLISESALKKRKQLYIRPDKETGGRTIRRYFNDLVVGRATCINGLYVVQLAPKHQYIAHASTTAKRQISQADRESMIPTIAKGDEGYNDQNDVDSDDSGIHQIDQQVEGGVETEAAEPKEKISYTAVACSSYAHIQPAPPEPHPKAPYKIKIPRMLKEAPQSPEASHGRQILTVEMTQHKKAKTHRFVKRPKEHYTGIKRYKIKDDIEQGRIKLHHILGVEQPADGLTKAYQRTPMRRLRRISVLPKSPRPD